MNNLLIIPVCPLVSKKIPPAPYPSPLMRLCHNPLRVIAWLSSAKPSDRRERGNLRFLTHYEIASVILLPRNDNMTQPLRGAGPLKHHLKNSFNGVPDLPEDKSFVPLFKAECVNIKFLVPVQDARNAMGEHAKTGQYSV